MADRHKTKRVFIASKELKHSSTRITSKHYIENLPNLGIRNLKEISLKKLRYENKQTRLFDFTGY